MRNATAVAAIAGLVFVAQQALPLVNVSTRAVFGLIAAALVGVLGLLVTLWNAQRSEEAQRAAEEQEVDALLACWPPPKVSKTNAYDLGALPSAGDGGAPSEYIARTGFDAKLDERVRDASVTLVVGATGAGKSRAAFEALSRTAGEWRVLVPENGASLNGLLALEPGRFLNGEDAVLWLDDVDRYLENLQLDGLDALRRNRVRVVGTIRRERLLELVESPTEEGRLARRLVARASVLELPDELKPAELSEARRLYPDRDFSRGIPGAFPVEWSRPGPPLYSPGLPATRPAPQFRSDPTVIGAFVLVIALLGVLVYLWTTHQALKPRPLTEQLADQRHAALAGCGRATVQPRPRDNAPDRSVFFVIRHADGCGESDALHVFSVRDGRLERAGTFEPKSPRNSFYRLQCRGRRREAPCYVEAASESPAFVAAWMDTSTGWLVPFVVHRSQDRYAVDALEVLPPVDPSEAPVANEDRDRYRDKVVIPAKEGDAIEGYPVEEFALLQSGEVPRLARAFVWRGSWTNPRDLEVVPKRLRLQPPPSLQPCTLRTPSTQLDSEDGSGFVVRVPPRQRDISRLLHDTWTEMEDRSDGSC